MYIEDIIWIDEIVNKIAYKHRIIPEEVEEVFYNVPRYRKAEKGKYEGEDLYYAYGQTDSGRYLLVIFIYKKTKDALIISARDMDKSERKKYVRK
ncbi:BrnT family toxin [candidate division KSB1 bacterium]|nr:BrnT family toxin [candidate division KSB1 bacterium]